MQVAQGRPVGFAQRTSPAPRRTSFAVPIESGIWEGCGSPSEAHPAAHAAYQVNSWLPDLSSTTFARCSRRIPALDQDAVAAIRERDAQLTKPPGSLGRLEEIPTWLGGVQGRTKPTLDRPLVAVFAGNHGVTAQGVSPYPTSVTRSMVENFRSGGAAINQFCASFDLGLKVFELALDNPTEDFTRAPAMDEGTCAATMAYGMEAIAGDIDLLCLGEMGIGNTTRGRCNLPRPLRRLGR